MKNWLLERSRAYLRERRAAAWIVRMDEDPVRHEEGLRRWVGADEGRAEAYSRAYRSFHGAAAAARQIYPRQTARSTSERPNIIGGRRLRLALGAGLSLAIASAAVLFTLNRLDILARPAAPAARVYATRIGEVRSVHLADGSTLVVDTATTVRVALSPSAREVTLVRGRVRFEVAHDAGRPFVVLAEGARITDRGTVFDVEAYRRVTVRLISGAVDISLPRARGTILSSVVRLHPGQQFGFNPDMTAPPAAPGPVPASDLQWVSGMKTFDDVPVDQIIDEVNRYSTTKIVLADPTIGARRVFLDLDIRDSAGVAQNLAQYLRLTVDTSVENTLILRPEQVADSRKN